MKIKKSDILANCIEVHSDDGRRIARVIKCLKGEYYTVYAIYPTVDAQECICKRCKIETAHSKATGFVIDYEDEIAQKEEEQNHETIPENSDEITEERAAEEVTDPKAEYINWAADRCIKAADELENQYIDIVDVPAEDIVAVADEIRRRGHDHIAYGERNTECIEKLHSLLMHGWQMRRMVDLNEKRNRDWYEGSPEGKFIVKHAFMLRSTRERI